MMFLTVEGAMVFLTVEGLEGAMMFLTGEGLRGGNDVPYSRESGRGQ